MPLPRATIASASPCASSIGARRLTSSARSISSIEYDVSRPLPGSAALATSTSTSPASASSRSGASGTDRSASIARPPISCASGSSTSTRRPVSDELRAARGERPGDRLPEPAGRAGEQDPGTIELHRANSSSSGAEPPHANTATVAVKLCRKYPPPTGPISPAAKNPAAGAPARASATASAS